VVFQATDSKQPDSRNKELAMQQTAKLAIIAITALTLSACAPEVGSKKWCEQMKERPKGELTMNEISDFAKHCIFPKEE